MPQRHAGVKDLRKNKKNHMRNLDVKTALKKTIKSYLTSIEQKNKDEAVKGLTLVYKKLDKATKRNLLTKNTTSRRKSRFAKLLTSLT